MEAKEFKVRWVMAIDIDKCTGCGACMVACQAENNLAPVEDASFKLRVMNWLVVYELSNKQPFPDHDIAYLPRPCMQCGNPPCVSVCPVIATDKNEEGGIVSQVTPRCIGCRYCMAACPYHARYFNWFDPSWPEGMEKVLTPDVSVRPRGVVEKCTFCHHRFMQAKDKAIVEGRDPEALNDGDYVTSCAEACPNGAIVFGDVNNPDHAVYELARSQYACRLLERLHADPQVYYISRREWVRRQLDNYLENEQVKG
ncbi:menaquinone reductase iron-sulfur cluster-binding subunit QrcC [Desulfovibrio psychrotolerans]|uniref:Menaquinone reductase, iron-sulfur cluster-binding subunit n=1 Tax=Desulfovibrio psychrotolerans TaxID=415242 RepID=A0A7J0BQG2_9BACT|nr:menaquinone reductase iron-sulfur cluster-binding subunit QrcC [Desulfovibrio psychrotolerans]GFM35953.1 menaquinone reductase, iron-sulfur cluster-binding subunit [Desulfovibrio psychrotolerans]